MKRTLKFFILPLLCSLAILAFFPGMSLSGTKSAPAKTTVKKSAPAKKATAPAKKGAAVKKKSTAAKKSASKKAATSKRKKAPVAKVKAEDIKKAEVPVEQPEIPQEIVDALARNDVNGAIILMREERPNPKLMYLQREATRIASFGMSGRPGRSEAHKFYQNAAISNHNLYLFLKARGIDQPDLFKEAMRLYGKARSAATPLHKAECDLLQAALLASSGEKEKAEKKYMKIDDDALRGDFESMEYLAVYHAAMGNIEGTLAALDAAHRLNPAATLTWIAVGDDFYEVASRPEFQALMMTWKAREASEKLTLSLPKGEKPRLQMTDESNLFRPQKSMPHYNLKKAPPKKKAAAVKGSKKGASKPKSAQTGKPSTAKKKK